MRGSLFACRPEPPRTSPVLLSPVMNLLSLIIIFLALVLCGAIAYIAWELTSESSSARNKVDEGVVGEQGGGGDAGEADSTQDGAGR